MAGDMNIIADKFRSDTEKLRNLQMMHDKLKKECDIWQDKLSISSQELDQIDQSLKEAGIENKVFVKILQRKQAEQEKLTEGFRKHEEALHTERLDYDVNGLSNKFREHSNDFDAIEEDYDKEQIQSAIRNSQTELQLLDEELQFAIAHYERLCAEYVPEEPIKVDICKILQQELEYKKALEDKLKYINEKLL